MTPSALIVAGLLCLVGCAPPPPLLDISGHACTPAPELVGAASLALGDPLRPDVVKLTIDENSRCLQTADGKSLYGAFQLPDRPQPFMIAVRSAPACPTGSATASGKCRAMGSSSAATWSRF
jgi:hypothetical protein